MDEKIGVYIHIPFCAKKCPYCDFYSVSYRKELVNSYTNSIISEILSYKNKNLTADTIYFGGGTPSLLTEEQLTKVIKAVKSSLTISENAEITLEANPNTLNSERLYSFLKAGINRLSIGVQSFNDNELKSLGRLHSAEQAKNSILLASECGFDNISIDIMLGTPYQTKESLSHTLNVVTQLPATHISAYMLTVEEDTAYYNSELISHCVCEDELADIYLDSADLFEKMGFLQYEISNFAKKGFESRHNLKYWRCQEYIGIGAAAHSYLNGKRFFNPNDISSYISLYNSAVNPIADRPVTDEAAGSPEEWLMLGLRLFEGISVERALKYFYNDLFLNKVDELKKLGFVNLSNDKKMLSLTKKGALVSNSVISELISIDRLP